jgi:hypothetical protein
MPQQTLPSGQDWDPVNVGRSSVPGKKGVVPKTAREVTMLKAAGALTTEKRFGAGGNKSAHSAGPISTKKLEEADDVGTLAKVDKSLSKAIMQVCVLVCLFVCLFGVWHDVVGMSLEFIAREFDARRV